MMYATLSDDWTRSGLRGDSASRFRSARAVNTWRAPLSCTMKAWRSAGALTSSGTYTAAHLRIASWQTSKSSERGSAIATLSPGCTPWLIR